MTRAEYAWHVIALVHARLPEDMPFKERKKAIDDAYPFGEREYWPYRAWCKARRKYLNRYDPKAKSPPSAREMLKGRDDIIFPFAEPSA